MTFASIATTEAWTRALDHPGEPEVPLPPRSPGVIAKLLIDRLIVQAMALTSPEFWVRDGLVQPASRRELEDTLVLQRERGWDRSPARFHATPPALDQRQLRLTRPLAAPFELLRFESAYEPDRDDPARARWLAYDANRTAHAWIVRHPDDSPRPWLVCIHAFGMGRPWLDVAAFRARELCRARGLNVLGYAMPLHGARRGGGGMYEPFAGGIGNLIHLQAQAIWDLRRIVGWLRDRGAPRVGVYGISLGGYATALLAALDPDLACAVAGVPATCFAGLLRSNVPQSDPSVLAPFWADTERALRVVSPLALPPRIPRERRFLFGGLADQMATPRTVHELWLHWERPRVAWYPGSHISFFLEPEVQTLLDEAFTAVLA